MEPISAAAGVVGATKGIVDLAKAAIEYARKEKHSDELIKLIQDIREQAQNLREENLDLRNEVAGLKKQLDIESKLIFDKDNLLWIVDGDRKDGPYCSQCKDTSNQMVHLHAQPRGERGTFHVCPACKAQPDLHALASDSGSIVRVNKSNRGAF